MCLGKGSFPVNRGSSCVWWLVGTAESRTFDSSERIANDMDDYVDCLVNIHSSHRHW